MMNLTVNSSKIQNQTLVKFSYILLRLILLKRITFLSMIDNIFDSLKFEFD